MEPSTRQSHTMQCNAISVDKSIPRRLNWTIRSRKHKRAVPPTAKSGLRPPHRPTQPLGAPHPRAGREIPQTAFLLRRRALAWRRHGENVAASPRRKRRPQLPAYTTFSMCSTRGRGAFGAGGLGKLGRTISRRSFVSRLEWDTGRMGGITGG